MSLQFDPHRDVQPGWRELLFAGHEQTTDASQDALLRELLENVEVRAVFDQLIDASIDSSQREPTVEAIARRMELGDLAAIQASLLFGGQVSSIAFEVLNRAIVHDSIDADTLAGLRVSQEAIYAGSFDPITIGHRDVIERAAAMFPRVIIAIGVNEEKTPLFTEQERAEMIAEETAHLGSRVLVSSFDGLLAHFAKNHPPAVLIRGVRGVTDIDFELMLATFNRKEGAGELETLFLPSKKEHRDISSSIARTSARYNAETLRDYVSPAVARRLLDKFGHDPDRPA
jgi:pantetheine-phosphate adenylyltransferase